MQEKKVTKAQLEKKIANAVLFVEKTKETKSVYFSDKGMRLILNDDVAIIETGHHRHVFSMLAQTDVSKPYLYTKRVVELALENDCTVKSESGEQFYSFARLLEVLKEKDESLYNIAYFFQMWVQCIFFPLYMIGESEVEAFTVYLDFVSIIARNSIMLEEKNESLSSKQFVEKYVENIKAYTSTLQDVEIFKKMSDEEFVQAQLKNTEQELYDSLGITAKDNEDEGE